MNKLTVVQAKRFGIYQCGLQTSLQEAAREMVEEDISGLVVVDADGCLAGIFTRTDLLHAGITCPDWKTHTVEQHMTRHVVTVSPHDSLNHVAQILIDKQIHRVVIVQHEGDRLRPLGVISDADLVYHMVKE